LSLGGFGNPQSEDEGNAVSYFLKMDGRIVRESTIPNAGGVYEEAVEVTDGEYRELYPNALSRIEWLDNQMDP
jgi:hypothetical protein